MKTTMNQKNKSFVQNTNKAAEKKKKDHTSCIQNEWQQGKKKGGREEGFTVFSATTQRRMKVCIQGR